MQIRSIELTFDRLKGDLFPEESKVVHLRVSEQEYQPVFESEIATTYGKRSSKASVIPIPARMIGASPILGVMVHPSNGPMGVSCRMT